LTDFCAAAENAVDITSAAMIAIVLWSRIGVAVYLNRDLMFQSKIL